MANTKRKKRRRAELFAAQVGLCFWCKRPMSTAATQRQPQPDNACTIDHLDTRNSALRDLYPEDERIVAACWGCNRQRNVKEQELIQPAVIAATPKLVAKKPSTTQTIAAATIRQVGIPGLAIQARNFGQHYQGRLNGQVIAEWWPSTGRLVVLGRFKEQKRYIHDEVLFANVCAVIAEQFTATMTCTLDERNHDERGA